MAAVASSSGSAVLRRVVAVTVGVLLIATGAFLLHRRGQANSSSSASGPQPSRVAGFDQIAFRIRTAEGVARHCGLLALTRAQQDKGLMNRTDLAGYDGMLFVFPTPTTTEFYMKDTLISLSIAWFDASGRFVSATDMTPCLTGDACPLYQAGAPYTVALEVAAGQLAHLGVAAGSMLSVGGSC
jgi:uncharacterized membrane protein (UPF0127 family)